MHTTQPLLLLLATTLTLTLAAAIPHQPLHLHRSSIQARQNQTDGAAAGGAAADFGSCTPTIDFQLGRAGRKPDEGTFLPTDPVVAEGQQDALNPNIITNRVCDQLTNVCDANQAAKDLCDAAKATVAGLGTKDATTADAFNSALGF